MQQSIQDKAAIEARCKDITPADGDIFYEDGEWSRALGLSRGYRKRR